MGDYLFIILFLLVITISIKQRTKRQILVIPQHHKLNKYMLLATTWELPPNWSQRWGHHLLDQSENFSQKMANIYNTVHKVHKVLSFLTFLFLSLAHAKEKIKPSLTRTQTSHNLISRLPSLKIMGSNFP